MKTTFPKTFLFIICMCFYSACHAVTGDGNVTLLKRTVTGFNALTINGPFKLDFTNDRQSDFFIITETDKNLQQYITITQTSSGVFISIQPGIEITQFSKMVLHVDNSNISNLIINATTQEASDFLLPVVCNGCHIKITGSIPITINFKVICHQVKHNHTFKNNNHTGQIATLKAEIDNKCTTTFTGDIDAANIVNNGTGQVSAFQLKTNVLRARNNSAGIMEVYSFDKFQLNNMGQGRIYYKGEGSSVDLSEKIRETICREPFFDSVYISAFNPAANINRTADGFNTDSLFQIMMDRDQSHRQTGKFDGPMAKHDDVENFACLKWYLNKYGYPEIKTEPLNVQFTTLFQHIDNYENFMSINDTLVKAVSAGKLLPNVYAYAYDRSMLAKKLKPVFYYFLPGSDWEMANKPTDIELPAVNKKRTSIGLPPYPQLLNGKYF